MRCCSVLFKALNFFIDATERSEFCVKLLKNFNVAFLCYGFCLSLLIFKPKKAFYVVLGNGYPGSAFCGMQRFLKNFIRSLCTLKHMILFVNLSAKQKMSFITKPFFQKIGIFFNFFLKRFAHHYPFMCICFCQLMLELNFIGVHAQIIA